MNRFTSKISYIIVTFFMAAIIVSFALTGFQGFNSSADAVATVDGTPVKIREYQTSLSRKLDFYSKMFKGKSLTSQQIRQFKLKESTLQELINQKLVTNLADNMDFAAGQEEVRAEIKQLPYFLTNKKFDVRKYKQLLTANRFTPTSFEESVASDIKLKKMSSLLSSISVSKNYAKDILKFKKNTAVVNAIKFEKEKLTQYLDVPKSKITAFVSDEKNTVILESLYKSNERDYNKPAQVQASHILLKADEKNAQQVLAEAKKIRSQVTPQNFAKLANQYTQDPSGKGKGGSLGWFSKGRMVPEFEKAAFNAKPGTIVGPIKTQFGQHIIYIKAKKAAINTPFEQVKNELAKKHLQKTDRKALNEKVKSLTAELDSMLKNNKVARLKALQKKYDFIFEQKAKLNMYDMKAGTISFDDKDLMPIFSKRDNNGFISKEDGPYVVLMSIVNFTNTDEAKEAIEKDLSSEVAAQRRDIANTFNQKLVEALQKKARIVTYPKML